MNYEPKYKVSKCCTKDGSRPTTVAVQAEAVNRPFWRENAATAKRGGVLVPQRLGSQRS